MYKVSFEAEVNGIASVKRFESELYVKADTAKSARDKATEYIKSAYSDTFAIFEISPAFLLE